jgi:hypothetical protein
LAPVIVKATVTTSKLAPVIVKATVTTSKLTPVIVKATVTTSKSFRKYLSNVTGKDHSNELAKKAILGNAYRLQKVLMQKYATFNQGNCITCTTNCNYRTATTLHTPETRFVSGTQNGAAFIQNW